MTLLYLSIFLTGYLINIFYITVLYHRGLTHQAIRLRPWTQKLVIHTGNWITGLDPKGWACMHRLHHFHSDTPQDPHSPIQQGVFRLLLGQLRSYKKTLSGLNRNVEYYTSVVKDLNFPVNGLNRKRLWFFPYLMHASLAVLISLFFHNLWMGLAYWLGIMSHPIQGWMVNAFAHCYGYTNFQTHDHSKNNTLVAWLVMGEGYQNNHHHLPNAAKFSMKWWEVDTGYALCWMAQKLRMIDFIAPKQPTLPSPQRGKGQPQSLSAPSPTL